MGIENGDQSVGQTVLWRCVIIVCVGHRARICWRTLTKVPSWKSMHVLKLLKPLLEKLCQGCWSHRLVERWKYLGILLLLTEFQIVCEWIAFTRIVHQLAGKILNFRQGFIFLCYLIDSIIVINQIICFPLSFLPRHQKWHHREHDYCDMLPLHLLCERRGLSL